MNIVGRESLETTPCDSTQHWCAIGMCLFTIRRFLKLVVFVISLLCVFSPVQANTSVIHIEASKNGLLTGEISDASLRDVLLNITELTGLTFYIDPRIKKEITLTFNRLKSDELVNSIASDLSTVTIWGGEDKDLDKLSVQSSDICH